MAGLTFGLGLFTGQHPTGGPPLYLQAPALAREAEEAGFDAFWVSEHHGLPDGYLPAPLTLLAAAATATRSIRLGTGLVIAPLQHPLRLAEEAAVVDQLCEGRLVLGLGLGYAEHEYRAFGVSRSSRGARLTDLMALLRKAWTGEPFDWAGPALHGEGLRVTPVPAQGSDLPIWLGGYAPTAVARSGRHADGHLVGRADPAIVRDALHVLEQSRGPDDARFTVGVTLLVAVTDEPDHLEVRAGFHHQQQTYEAIQAGLDVFSGHVPDPQAQLDAADVSRYFHAWGTTSEVVDQLAERLQPLRPWANVHVMLRALVPQVDLAAQLRRTRRLGQEVLPPLRAALAKPAPGGPSGERDQLTT